MTMARVEVVTSVQRRRRWGNPPVRQPHRWVTNFLVFGLYRTLTRNLSMGAVFAVVCSPRSFACVGCLMQSVCAAADARETVRPT